MAMVLTYAEISNIKQSRHLAILETNIKAKDERVLNLSHMAKRLMSKLFPGMPDATITKCMARWEEQAPTQRERAQNIGRGEPTILPPVVTGNTGEINIPRDNRAYQSPSSLKVKAPVVTNPSVAVLRSVNVSSISSSFVSTATRERVVAFYQTHNPDKLDQVDAILMREPLPLRRENIQIPDPMSVTLFLRH